MFNMNFVKKIRRNDPIVLEYQFSELQCTTRLFKLATVDARYW